MRYKVTWDTIMFAGVNKTLDEKDLMKFLADLDRLGFTAKVEIVDE